MLPGLKELVIVLAISTVVFRILRPLALRFSSEANFCRRRNVWIFLTLVAFLSPNVWIFFIIAGPVYLVTSRKDSNPVAYYLFLLHVIPPVPFAIPIGGSGSLFDLDNYRLLSLFVLIPCAWDLRKLDNAYRAKTFPTMNYLLLGYGAITVMLFVPPDLPGHIILQDSPTNVLRRLFLFWIDTYLVFYVVAKISRDKESILETLASFCISCGVLAALAIFESARHWLLYSNLMVRWSGDPFQGFYLFRGNSLRAQVSTGTPLALGYLIAIAMGFWLYLRAIEWKNSIAIGMPATLVFGILAAYSRGPWLGAIVIIICFVLVQPRTISGVVKLGVISCLVVAMIAATPLGDRIASVLPFMNGTVDSGNLVYRQQLLVRSWDLIQNHPFFGDQLAYLKLNDMRQGLMIIDLVNTYAAIAVFHGLIALTLFLGFLLAGLKGIRSFMNSAVLADADIRRLGSSLIACIIGTMIMISSSSLIGGYAVLLYVLAGMAAGYTNLPRKPKQTQSSSNTLKRSLVSSE